ncbi:MAG: fumarate hydratase [Eubacteriales bacterium]|nr:fumarate hydratase [Eubacteriales bacterium]
MREIQCETITKTVKELFIKANTVLPDEIASLLEKAEKSESKPIAKSILGKLCENRKTAEKTGIPICQDTGMAFVFAEIGQEVHITGGLFEDAVNAGVAAAYTEGYLRKSVVTPLSRMNTGDNTPAIIYTKLVSGDRIKLITVPKGFGSENMSKIKMMNPTCSEDDIICFICDTVREAGGRSCPPLVIGVGIGGGFDYVAFLAKKALARGGESSDPKLAELEGKIKKAVNATGVGVQGLGGNVTALKVAVETYPTHIASLPVAVNISCHVTRHAQAVI